MRRPILSHIALTFTWIMLGTATAPNVAQALSPLQVNYDVIVAGGGMGGMGAAIEAARHGHSVLVIEPTDWLGGQATAAAVPTMDGGSDFTGTGTYHWGAYNDLVTQLAIQYGSISTSTCYWGISPSFTTYCYEPTQVQNALLALIPQGSTFTILYREQVVGLLLNPNGSPQVVYGVQTANHGTILGQVVIDATETGDLIPMTNEQYRLGNGVYTGVAPSSVSGCIQDVTAPAIIQQYAPGTLPPALSLAQYGEPTGYWSALPYFSQMLSGSLVFSTAYKSWPYSPTYPLFTLGMELGYRALPFPSMGSYDGSLTTTNPGAIPKTVLNHLNDWPGYAYTYFAGQLSRQSQTSLPPADSTVLGAAALINGPGFNNRHWSICQARLKTYQFLYYIQVTLGQSQWSISTSDNYDHSQIPGGQPYNLVSGNTCADTPYAIPWQVEQYFPPDVYFRESRRLLGQHTLNGLDVERVSDPVTGQMRSLTQFASSIGIGDYPDDMHNCVTQPNLEPGVDLVQYDPLTESGVSSGGLFDVPMESLLPQNTRGFLVAEKNISVSRIANGATREQPVAMSIGQAVGVLAHAMIGSPTWPPQASAVQKVLVKENLPIADTYFPDLAPSESAWPYVQILLAYGGLSYFLSPFNGQNPSMQWNSTAYVTRDQAMAVAAAARGIPIQAVTPQTPSPFTDTQYGAQDFASLVSYVAALGSDALSAQQGWPSGEYGYPLGPFNGSQYVTRGQFAVMLMANAYSMNATTTQRSYYFQDAQPSDWDGSAAEALHEAGITAGCQGPPAPLFCPSALLTKDQMAILAARRLVGTF